MADNHRIGISGTGYYIPPGIESNEALSEKSGLPVSFFEQTYGLESKSSAGAEDTPSTMAIKAASNAIDNAGIDGADIGLVIYCAAGFYDYRFWTPASVVQSAIGAEKAFSFEIKNFCNSVNVALNYCRLSMVDDPDLDHALIVCGEKMSDMIDFSSETSRSIMFYADGAAAAVVSRNSPSLNIRSYFSKTEGRLSQYQQYIPVGGTVHPSFKGNYEKSDYFIQVRSPAKLKEIFDEIYVPNYIHVIKEALSRCGKTIDDIDLLLTNQLRRKITEQILGLLGLDFQNTYTTITKVGHVGAGDTLLCLAKCAEEKRFDSGSTIVLASSANGFSWGAVVLEA